MLPPLQGRDSYLDGLLERAFESIKSGYARVNFEHMREERSSRIVRQAPPHERLIEADIHSDVNPAHILGSRIMNGIGGSAGFARNPIFPFS